MRFVENIISGIIDHSKTLLYMFFVCIENTRVKKVIVGASPVNWKRGAAGGGSCSGGTAATPSAPWGRSLRREGGSAPPAWKSWETGCSFLLVALLFGWWGQLWLRREILIYAISLTRRQTTRDVVIPSSYKLSSSACLNDCRVGIIQKKAAWV